MDKPIGVARVGRGSWPPKYLAYLVILCFERRYPKQNTVARLKSKILAPPKFFCPRKKLWAGYTAGQAGLFATSQNKPFFAKKEKVKKSRIFCPTPTPDAQMDHFLHYTPKLGIPVEMVQFPLKLLLNQRFLAVYHDFH